MDMVRLVCEIPQEFYRLVKSGAAVLGPGGIRKVGTMEILKQYNPIPMLEQVPAASASPNLGIPLLAVQAVSSVADSVMTYQNGKKLNELLQYVKKITEAMNSLGQIKELAWAQLALQVATYSATVEGFRTVMDKLDKIHGELHDFHSQYLHAQDRKVERTWKKHCSTIRINMSNLEDRKKRCQRGESIESIQYYESMCADIFSFIDDVLDQFTKQEIDQRIACRVIFTLTPAYAEFVNELYCQLRSGTGRESTILGDCRAVLDKVNGKEFREFMQTKMAFDPEYCTVSPEKRADALRVVFHTLKQAKANLDACEKALESIPTGQLTGARELLNQLAWEKLREAWGLETEEAMIEEINRRIMEATPPADPNAPVIVPLQVFSAEAT